MVLCFLAQIDYNPGAAREEEGPKQDKHKADTQMHDRYKDTFKYTASRMNHAREAEVEEGMKGRQR